MLRERVTVTLEPDLIQAIDQLVDRQTLRNRSHAFEHLLKEGIGSHQLTRAFLFWPDGLLHQARLEALLTLFAGSSVRRLYACAPAGSPLAAEAQAVIGGFAGVTFHAQVVPSDFGTGGAVEIGRAHV